MGISSPSIHLDLPEGYVTNMTEIVCLDKSQSVLRRFCQKRNLPLHEASLVWAFAHGLAYIRRISDIFARKDVSLDFCLPPKAHIRRCPSETICSQICQQSLFSGSDEFGGKSMGPYCLSVDGISSLSFVPWHTDFALLSNPFLISCRVWIL